MELVVNAYSTLRQPPPVDFSHRLVAKCDRSDTKFYDHLHRVMSVILDSGGREMTSLLYAVMQHVGRVQHHYRFEIDESNLGQISNWGWASNSILLLPDGSVRDPSGRVLVDRQSGRASGGAEVPFPADARQRTARTHQKLDELKIPKLDDLPPVVSELEVTLRTADDVAWRSLSLFIVAVRAESLASGSPIAVAKLRDKSPMAFQSLSKAEQSFLDLESPDEQSIINAAWRYEALYTLQWALGLHRELTFADNICDVPLVAETMVRRSDAEIVTQAKLRDTGEILDALDLNQRLLWAARQAASEGVEAPRGIDGGVLSERQHALNWLVQFSDAPWDDVDTPT